MVDFEALRQELRKNGQDHLLRFWDNLNAEGRQQLVRQLENIDLAQVHQLHESREQQENVHELLAAAGPPPAIRWSNVSHNRIRPEAAREAGEQLLRQGAVGAVLVAGGQGTRLGFDRPKGMYPIGPVSNRTLFEMHVDQLRACAARYQTRIPLFLMTSPATHEETLDFFESHQRFGLPEDDLHVFCQGTMPAVDGHGKLLLDAKDRIATSPDGHGGMVAAFSNSGCMSRAAEMGVRELFYFQVDNPLVPICDPALIGYHRLAESEMTTLVVAKTDPLDRVGNVVSVDGRLMIVEYSDLPEEAARRVDAEGQLVFWAGSIAVHVISLGLLRRALGSDDSLPFHRAKKSVPYLDQAGNRITPDEANATKFEKFLFDLMPDAKNALVVEADPREVFAPLKNASGAEKDTPELTRDALINQAKRRLAAAEIKVADGVKVEIHPRFDVSADGHRRLRRIAEEVVEDTFFE